ncbi:hypothetical protein T484DRAFT_3021453 [Baffinella frigidus]|nr:hypothetical protein T484DRAFT_3021453 [Cryptophyta sp. CCMP2293]
MQGGREGPGGRRGSEKDVGWGDISTAFFGVTDTWCPPTPPVGTPLPCIYPIPLQLATPSLTPVEPHFLPSRWHPTPSHQWHLTPWQLFDQTEGGGRDTGDIPGGQGRTDAHQGPARANAGDAILKAEQLRHLAAPHLLAGPHVRVKRERIADFQAAVRRPGDPRAAFSWRRGAGLQAQPQPRGRAAVKRGAQPSLRLSFEVLS